MAHPSNGQLPELEIPGTEQSVKALKKMKRIRRAELISAVSSGEDYLWVMDEEPSNQVPENYDEWRKKYSGASVFKDWKITHEVVKGFLFPEEPSALDVRQAAIGDCWLLAAIASIVSLPQGPELIQNMMRQVKNGNEDREEDAWIVVRLYDKDIKPRYVKLRRTLIKHIPKSKNLKAKTFHSRGKAYWVAFLEKAMTTLLVTDHSFQPHDASYLNTISGNAFDGFRMLLGIDFEKKDMPPETGKDRYEEIELLMHAPDIFENYQEVRKSAIENDQAALLLNRVFFEEEVLAYYLKEGRGMSLRQKFDHFKKEKCPHIFHEESNMALEVRGSVRTEDFIKFVLYDSGLRKMSVKEAIINWVNTQQIFPSKRGTGKYSLNQLQMYHDIEQMVTACKPVVTGTMHHIGSKSDGIGHSGGEGKYKGLVGGHAYAVPAVAQNKGERFVLVSNPWGITGRGYESEHIEEIKEGLFWLELSDFSKRFTFYATTVTAPGTVDPNLHSNILQPKIPSIMSTHGSDSSHGTEIFQEDLNSTRREFYYQLGYSYMCKQNFKAIKAVNFNYQFTGKDWKHDTKKMLKDISLTGVKVVKGVTLTFQEWRDISSVLIGSRTRVVELDTLVEAYCTKFNGFEMPKRDHIEQRVLFSMLDKLGIILNGSEEYLSSFKDSGRRNAVKRLQYLVVAEIMRIADIRRLSSSGIHNEGHELLQLHEVEEGNGLKFLRAQMEGLLVD